MAHVSSKSVLDFAILGVMCCLELTGDIWVWEHVTKASPVASSGKCGVSPSQPKARPE